MKRLVVAVVLLLVACVVGLGVAGPASARPSTPARGDGIDWGWAGQGFGVVMYLSDPDGSDPHVHARFKRYGGEGQRQVRMKERQWDKTRKRWSPYTVHGPAKLLVGEKVVYTTDAALPCEPRKHPLGVVIQMRVKPKGQPWSPWQMYATTTFFLMECPAG